MSSGKIQHKALAFLFIVGACGGDQRSRTATTDGTASSQDPSPSAVVSAPVTELGIGPLRAGMTVAEARTALGAFGLPASAEKSGCDYASSPNLPRGVSVMVEDGIVGRIDVRTNSVPTSEGARVGETEERILKLYGKRVRVTPHKYTDGHYLTVTPASGDTTHLIIFETDADTVTNYRAGRLPQVRYVEGCS